MDLYIHVFTSPSLNLNVRIHLQHSPTQEQSNTVKCLHHFDILGHLEEYIYCEILDLNAQIMTTPPEAETFTFKI